MAIPLTTMVFQDSVTSAGNGNELIVDALSTIVFDISGTATASTVIFEAKATADSDYRTVACLRASDYTLASQTTTKNETWQFDIGGFHSFRTRIGSITGGNITIRGRAS